MLDFETAALSADDETRAASLVVEHPNGPRRDQAIAPPIAVEPDLQHLGLAETGPMPLHDDRATVAIEPHAGPIALNVLLHPPGITADTLAAPRIRPMRRRPARRPAPRSNMPPPVRGAHPKV